MTLERQAGARWLQTITRSLNLILTKRDGRLLESAAQGSGRADLLLPGSSARAVRQTDCVGKDSNAQPLAHTRCPVNRKPPSLLPTPPPPGPALCARPRKGLRLSLSLPLQTVGGRGEPAD